MSSPPSPSRHTPSPTGRMSAMALATPRATVPPTSPSPHPHVKVPHVHSDEDEDEQAQEEAAVPHKRPCTDAVHVGGLENDLGLACVKKEPGMVDGQGAVKHEPGIDVQLSEAEVWTLVDVKMEHGQEEQATVSIKQEPPAPPDLMMADDTEGQAKVKPELGRAETADDAQDQGVTMDLANPPETPTVFVYRSVYTTKPTWDRFVPVTEGPELEVLGRHCILRASGTEVTTQVHNPQAHVLLDWKDPRPSMYISFSTDLEWSIYFQLKHEFFHHELGHVRKYAEVMEWRDLYALQVTETDLYRYTFTDKKAINFARTQHLLLGQLQVRALRHARVVIPNKVRRTTMAWCQYRHGYDRKYPYEDWRAYIAARCESDLQAAVDPVDMWEADKSDEEVDTVIAAGLKANSTSARDFLV